MTTVFTLQGDLKFFYLAKTADTLGPADVQIQGKDLLRDPGFETSVLISLFSNARSDDMDSLPDSWDLRGGYWGSALVDFQIGSKLWLRNRMKITEANLRLFEQDCVDALAWMKTSGIAESVEVMAARGARKDQVDFVVNIYRPIGDDILFKFFVNWEYQTVGGLQ